MEIIHALGLKDELTEHSPATLTQHFNLIHIHLFYLWELLCWR